MLLAGKEKEISLSLTPPPPKTQSAHTHTHTVNTHKHTQSQHTHKHTVNTHTHSYTKSKSNVFVSNKQFTRLLLIAVKLLIFRLYGNTYTCNTQVTDAYTMFFVSSIHIIPILSLSVIFFFYQANITAE